MRAAHSGQGMQGSEHGGVQEPCSPMGGLDRELCWEMFRTGLSGAFKAHLSKELGEVWVQICGWNLHDQQNPWPPLVSHFCQLWPVLVSWLPHSSAVSNLLLSLVEGLISRQHWVPHSVPTAHL